MDFIKACKNNDIELAKTYPIPDQHELNRVFIYACSEGQIDIAKWLYEIGAYIEKNIAIETACAHGHLDIAKWLHGTGAVIDPNMEIRRACYNGKLNVVKWLQSVSADISDDKNNDIFILACQCGHLDIAQWLYSQCVNISAQNNLAFRWACFNGCLNVAKWLIDIHYKYGGYIQFDSYNRFTNKIKNILIDNNLINPSTLSRRALKYYLNRTDNFVPQDFTTPHNGFTVRYRGSRTKPAPHD